MEKIAEQLFKFVPALDSLRRYSLDALGKDAIAGVTVATVAVPQAMAYAVIAGVHPQYGLYTAIVLTIAGAFFDSSRLLITGPTNAISIAIFSAVALMPEHQRVEAAVLLAFLVGVIQIAITLFRLGDLTRFISHGVIIGFTLGAGILILLGQLGILLGLANKGEPHDHFLVRFWLTISESSIHGPTMAIGVGSIVAVLLLRAIKRRLQKQHRFVIPEFLITITIASLAVWAFGIQEAPADIAKEEVVGVRIVGPIPSALPAFDSPKFDWSRIRGLGGSALAIAVLGLLEAIAMAKVIAAKSKRKLDINQQCLSEGVANLAGSFFQCFPGSGSLTRSAINQQSGAVSQWAAVISAITVAAMVLLLARFAYYIPYAALAGLLMVTAWRIVDRKQLLYHLRTTRFDALIVLVTAFSAVFISVEFCILIGVFLSFVLYVPRAARLEMTELQVTPERVIQEKSADDAPCGHMLIYNLEGELFFGSAPNLERHFETIRNRTGDGVRIVVLRCKYARNLDAVCLKVLEQFVYDMMEHRVHLILAGVRPDLLKVLRNSRLYDTLGSKRIFPEQPGPMSSTLDAVRHAYDLLEGDFCSICPKRQHADGDESWYYMI